MIKSHQFDSFKSSPLGLIPIDWEIKIIGDIVNLIVSNVDKKSHSNEIKVHLCNYIDVYKNSFINSSLDFMIATATLEEINKFKLQEDDVVITKDSETPDDIAVPALIKENIDNLICGYHLAILRPFSKELSGLYLLYALHIPEIRKQFSIYAQGATRFGLTYGSINNVNIPLPPYPNKNESLKSSIP